MTDAELKLLAELRGVKQQLARLERLVNAVALDLGGPRVKKIADEEKR